MTYFIYFVCGYVCCFFSMWIAISFGKAARAEEQAFADDPRPSILREQAE